MNIKCDCGQFEAEITNFPDGSPGRLACYCDDCQGYMKKIGRQDLLDEYGGTEIIPVYPKNLQILKGKERLQCHRLSPNGLSRWTVTCCNSPIANTKAKFPWLGLIHSAVKNGSPEAYETLGPVKSRIFGKYCSSKPPFAVSEKMGFRDAAMVMPFILKGMVFKKYRDCPLFENDNVTPISKPVLLPRNAEG